MAVVVALAAGAGALAAHDTWLAASPSAIAVGERATVDMTSAGTFPTPETAIRPQRIVRAQLRLGGDSFALRPGRGRARVLRLESEPLPRAGTATVLVSLAPRTLTLRPDQVAHYLEEVGADPSLVTRDARTAEPWVETYAKHAKSFVRVGDAPGDTSWRVPTGARVELMPMADPVRLRAGTTLAVRLLRCGAPLAGQPVGWVRGGSTPPGRARTDVDGVVRIPLDRAGRWLVRTTVLRRSVDGAASDGCALPVDSTARGAVPWRSDFATLVVDVR